VSFASKTLCVASQRVFVVVYFLMDSVRKLLVTLSYTGMQGHAVFVLNLCGEEILSLLATLTCCEVNFVPDCSTGSNISKIP